MIEIGLQSEYVMIVAGLPVTNVFFTSVLVTVILGIAGLIFRLSHGENGGNIFSASLRVLIYELLKLTDSVTGDRKLSRRVLPLIATFFIFIGFANLLELVPGFFGSFVIRTPSGEIPFLRSPDSSLTTTLALAIVSVVAIQFFSLRELGTWRYLRRFFDLSGPIRFFMGFFELLSESVKVLSFSFRLFGNIFAGEVLLIVTAFLVPYLIPVPFMVLEVFVGVIQAFIFAILTLAFIKSSTLRHLGDGDAQSA